MFPVAQIHQEVSEVHTQSYKLSCIRAGTGKGRERERTKKKGEGAASGLSVPESGVRILSQLSPAVVLAICSVAWVPPQPGPAPFPLALA